MEPLVTFVVPCYKLAHLLPDCIESILAQTYSNFEILVMDNCSPDNTPGVARSFHDPRVKHIRNQVNIGHIRNFNKGITMARGKYVWLVSADDFLTSRHVLGRFVDLMDRNPRVGYVFCRATTGRGPKEMDKPPSWTDCGADRIWNGLTFLRRRLVWGDSIIMSAVMVRKECYDKITLFPPDLPYSSDWYMWCMLALHHAVAYLSEVMVCWRVHDESLSTSFNSGDDPVCIVDELSVLWRVARQAELTGVPSLRRVCNAAIASRVVRALKSSPAFDPVRPGLSESEFEIILQRNVRDSRDEEDLRARLSIALGDAQFWSGHHMKATELYRVALKLRPWWLKSWAKYLFLRTGSAGISTRRLLTLIATGTGLKDYPGNL